MADPALQIRRGPSNADPEIRDCVRGICEYQLVSLTPIVLQAMALLPLTKARLAVADADLEVGREGSPHPD